MFKNTSFDAGYVIHRVPSCSHVCERFSSCIRKMQCEMGEISHGLGPQPQSHPGYVSMALTNQQTRRER